MAFEVSCEDLRIANCDFSVQAETPAEVVDEFGEHLKEVHDMNMPTAEQIVEGGVDKTQTPERVRLVVARLREALNLGFEGTSEDIPKAPPAEVPPQG